MPLVKWYFDEERKTVGVYYRGHWEYFKRGDKMVFENGELFGVRGDKW
jgi:hypothetical protein